MLLEEFPILNSAVAKMLMLSIICLGVYMQVCDPSSGLVPLQTCEQGEGILSLLPNLADR